VTRGQLHNSRATSSLASRKIKEEKVDQKKDKNKLFLVQPFFTQTDVSTWHKVVLLVIAAGGELQVHASECDG